MADRRSHAISVEVVYALPQIQTAIVIEVPPGTTVRQAIVQSEIALVHPEIRVEPLEAAIGGKRVALATVLHDHDRIEICRPLLADPKQARRRRARFNVGQER